MVLLYYGIGAKSTFSIGNLPCGSGVVPPSPDLVGNEGQPVRFLHMSDAWIRAAARMGWWGCAVMRAQGMSR